ncbi:hypothetical protein HHX47_DHR5001076 [Lentinula edodes]|nr:hypothetical protein HHX47_DHR5001076 [Lentinula edodes]
MAAPYRQDMPPPGGFEAVKYKRNLPFRGPGALAILGGVAAISAFGFYRYGQGALEKRWLRNVFDCTPLVDKRVLIWIRPPFPSAYQSFLGLIRELQREKAWSRIHLVPLLMAEGDRDAYRRQQAALAREKEIMKDVKGWEAGKSIYNNPKYASPQFVVL